MPKPILQSILIPIDQREEGEKWIKKHGYRLTHYRKPPDVTENFVRYRQRKPNPDKKYFTVKVKDYELVYMI